MTGKIRLLVMRLADMRVVHPDQVVRQCHECGHDVGVYPTGQQVLKRHPLAEIMCNVCRPPSEAVRDGVQAAGPMNDIRMEIQQSVPKVKQ